MSIIREVYLKSKPIISEEIKDPFGETLRYSSQTGQRLNDGIIEVTVLTPDTILIRRKGRLIRNNTPITSTHLLTGEAINQEQIWGARGSHNQKIVYRWKPEFTPK